jgi:hypothetical protein
MGVPTTKSLPAGFALGVITASPSRTFRVRKATVYQLGSQRATTVQKRVPLSPNRTVTV